MKKIYLIILLFVAILSCTKLDVPLYDSIPESKFPEDPAQAALLMIPVYKPMANFLDNGGWWFAQELTSEEMVCPTRNADWDDGGKWRVLHTHTWDNQTEAIANMWSTFYGPIPVINKFIELTFGPSAGTPAGDLTLAKLKIIRAYYYYLLIDNYGDVPYVNSFTKAVGNPYRNHREAIWDSIVTDIRSNLKFLDASSTKTAVSKAMAFSLLAKLYLNAQVYTGTAHWKEAEDFCDSVINLGSYSLESNPLAPFVTKNQNSPENIFIIPFDEDNNTGFNLHMRTLHYNSNLTFGMSVGPWNGFCATEDFYNTYTSDDKRVQGNNTFGIGNNKGYFLVGPQYTLTGEIIKDAGANDSILSFNPHIPALKMDASFTPQQIRMSGVRVAKFEIKTGAKANLGNAFPIFRYADILLMKAEAMIRQGNSGDFYINKVRFRAGLGDFSGCTLDQLLAERGREMFWEAHRRQDLIRFGKFNNAWWEKDASTPDRMLFPIPKWATDSNPNLDQPVQ
jgi:hypothetical protein